MDPTSETKGFFDRIDSQDLTPSSDMFILSRKSRISWREARNKARLRDLRKRAERKFSAQAMRRPPDELILHCYKTGTLSALCSVESLGACYAEASRQRKSAFTNLLSDPDLVALPAGSLSMLHAGMGLSFARHTLEGLTTRSPAAELRKALETFVELCRSASRPGYMGAAIESFGFETLTRNGVGMMQILDRQLVEMDPELSSYMWHGAGRALYLRSRHFLAGPRRPWQVLQMLQETSPHRIGQQNLLAGLAWAFTLANACSPEVMESLLVVLGDEFTDRQVFINGVSSSVTVCYDATPEDPHIEDFIEHSPNPADKNLCKLWRQYVREPCEIAINDIYPALQADERMQALFHYQSDLSS